MPPLAVFGVVLCLLPALAWFRLRLRGWSWSEAARIGLVWLAGLYAASPFFTESAIGTAEAYNYSHAVADTIEQMRAGTFPVYVGQSAFAFNGRVHPLRTAVYYTHAAGVLDRLTFHELSFWQIQNLSLALSIVAAGFVAYGCLVRLGGLPRWAACILAGWYCSCPALMAAAHGIELYMTVTAAPFLPLAVLGAVRSVDRPGARAFVLMAVGLAGAWLAHPPIAAWTTLGCGLVVLIGLVSQRPRWDTVVGILAAAAVGLMLAGWAFASSFTLSPGERLVIDNVAWNRSLIATEILKITESVGWSALLPIQKQGAALGDFQLGYAGWSFCLLGVCAALREPRRATWAILAAIILLLALTLPVPGLHAWLWHNLPTDFSATTNIWPMQRSYLVLSALVVVLAGSSWKNLAGLCRAHPRLRITCAALAAILIVWTLWQTGQVLQRGFANRHSREATLQMHQSTNRLLIQSYFLLGIPESYRGGPRDPEMEMRLLAYVDGPRIIADNSAKGTPPRIVQTGTLHVSQDSPRNIWHLASRLHLQPQRRYLLHLRFLVQPFDGLLVLSGSQNMFRQIQLRDPESKRGFGMLPGQSNTLPLWSDGRDSEEVQLALVPTLQRAPDLDAFAHFELEEIVPDQLPIRVSQLAPFLRCEIDSLEPGWLETPRMWVPGYTASVDGQKVHPRKGVDGLVLVPIPAGRHAVELHYRPPVILGAAATVSVGGWAVVAIGAMIALWPSLRVRVTGIAAFTTARRHGPTVAATTIVVAVVATAFWRQQADIMPASDVPGPLRLRVALPMHGLHRYEPLLSSGRGLGSTIFFLHHIDNETVQFGVDIHGAGARYGPPLKVDFRDPVDITISTGALFPQRSAGVSEQQFTWLRRHTVVRLGDREALYLEDPEPKSDPANFVVAAQRTGSGSIDPRFTGEVLTIERPPISPSQAPYPSEDALTKEAGPLRLRLQLPVGQSGRSEPLVTLGSGPNLVTVLVHYLDERSVRFGLEGPNVPLQFTAPLSHDFSQPLHVDVSHPALYPNGHSSLRDYSPLQQARLRSRIVVEVFGRRQFVVPSPSTSVPASAIAWFGENRGVASYPAAQFTGRFLGIARVDASAWPIPPGHPEQAIRPDAVGPIELLVRFPTNAPNRVQPLLTTGRTGEGTIVMVHYVDDAHVRIGADVWAKALFWTKPIPVDYNRPHRLVISSSSLMRTPETSTPALSVTIDGREVLRETISAYATTPAQITPGENHIGGSFSEPLFTGDLLEVSRGSVPRSP